MRDATRAMRGHSLPRRQLADASRSSPLANACCVENLCENLLYVRAALHDAAVNMPGMFPKQTDTSHAREQLPVYSPSFQTRHLSVSKHGLTLFYEILLSKYAYELWFAKVILFFVPCAAFLVRRLRRKSVLRQPQTLAMCLYLTTIAEQHLKRLNGRKRRGCPAKASRPLW